MSQIYMNAMIVGKTILEAADPEAEFSGFYSLIKAAQPADQDLPHELRVMALLLAAGARQQQLVAKILATDAAKREADKRARAPKASKRPSKALDDAKALSDMVNAKPGIKMFGNVNVFSIAERHVVAFFEETAKTGTLPKDIRLLIDYPIDAPVVFNISLEAESWEYWDVCTAIADKYKLIYKSPEKYGVWGHDIGDLVIENLMYYPKQRLIYPEVGS